MNCIEPVEPEFNYITGLITIKAIISNETGGSFVKIKESEIEAVFGKYVNVPVNNASITFVNTNTTEVVNLIEDVESEVYLPPNDFEASLGDTWVLEIKLADGREYKSLPETIKQPVAIGSIEAEFKQELEYSIEKEGYVPGHSIKVSFNDPVDEKNYYYWSFRSFETKVICLTCVDSYYRNGICDNFDGYYPRAAEPFYVTYLCEPDCWRIRYNQKIEILDDEFTNGSAISQLPIANILLHNVKDILVEIRQFSLSKPAYNYYKVLKDLTENNSGFNAPPPAALVGNMYNPNQEDEYVLGRFTAAATSKATIFLDRESLQGAIDALEVLFPESENNPTPPGTPEVLYAPCREGFYSTSIKPEDWPN
ncbi:hypothetical protein PW52_10770 [Tamlana sedimentorum]|uniref:DUF4249 domain-containing protein n=1 Tax=Neotamlana sedimentorum TaxID=1435349 RepID=A0A0D7W8Y4_9FLAO|nr:DUF4249 domain-containing protein [Tamlana sedimentorum]KJD35158.1 hypothetical protein PW52_10770 [Tamlana sedimentorum]